MDVSDAIDTRIELREFADETVDDDAKRAILDAGRLAPSGKNLQHWRFVLVEDDADLAQIADRSPTGDWLANADFAIAICTDSAHSFNEIDAGRAATHMQLAAWERDVGSCLFTTEAAPVRTLLEIPAAYDLTAVLGFGYPDRDIVGKKDREPLSEIAYGGRFGDPLELEK